MKLRHLLQMALMALPMMALAVPAPGGLLTVKNPDGSLVQVRAYGDENFCYYTDAEGKYLLERDSRGYWAQAVRQGRNLTVASQDIELLYDESPAGRRAAAPSMYERAPQRMAALTGEGRTTYTTEGEIPALVVLVEFKDTKFSIPDIRNQIDRYCNQEGYSDYKSKGSARDYFIHQSGGKFKPHFEVVGPLTASEDMFYYSRNNNDHHMLGYMMQEVLTALDDEVDFSRFDLDGDGMIDSIYFMYAGHSAADTGNLDYIWPHQGHFANFGYYEGVPDLYLDGVKMGPYAISNELKNETRLPYGATAPWLDGIGNFVHEYGHVLGLADLYDAFKKGPETATPKDYDVMDTGSYNDYATCPPGYSAYEKWVCKWIEFNETAEDATTYEVKSHSDGSNELQFRSRVPRAGTNRYTGEFFIVEARNNTAWDRTLPEEGLFIWKIDFDKTEWTQNRVNTNGYSRAMMQPSMGGSTPIYSWPYIALSGEVVDASYPGFHELRPKAYNPQYHFWLTDIRYDDTTKTGSFGHNMFKEMPTFKTEACIPTKYEAGYDLHLSWRPSDEAVDYKVTLKRIDPITLTERYVDGLNDKSVGNVTEYRARNLTAAMFKQNFEFYVRTVGIVPSVTTSNVVSFTTDNLLIYDPSDPYNEKATHGVDGVIADNVLIAGSAGSIIAPESAKVYGVNGQEYGKENLAPGVYIVRYGEKSVKVVVK